MTLLLPIEATLSESWKKVSGAKASYWGGLGLIFLFLLGINILIFILGLISPTLFDQHHPSVLSAIMNVATNIIEFLFQMGLVYFGIQRAFDNPISYRLIFKAFETRTALRLIGFFLILALLCMFLLIPIFALGFSYAFLSNSTAESGIAGGSISAFLGFIIFSAIIYLLVRLWLTTAFILDKQTGIWQSMKLSLQATRHNFWRIFFIGFLMGLIFLVSVIPLGIGLIWTFPMASILQGMVYKNLLPNTTL